MTMPLLAAFDLEFQVKTFHDRHFSKKVVINAHERLLKISHTGSRMFGLSIYNDGETFPEASLNLLLMGGELVLSPSFSEISFSNNGLNVTENKQTCLDTIAAFREMQNTRMAVIELVEWIMANEASFIEFMGSRAKAIKESTLTN